MVKRKMPEKGEDYGLNSKWLENDLSISRPLKLSRSKWDDYRQIPLYPTLEDVTNNPPPLPINHVNKPYKNCDEYLDTFFRLMREDFISVIRETLKSLKKSYKVKNNRLDKQKMLWIYRDVQIKSIKANLSIITFQFDTPTRANDIDYENSKQFKNGALLLFSKDQFVTFSLGIIKETFKLNNGLVGVDVIDFEKLKTWSHIDLFEPSVFYEPYRYVMGVFQDMYETNFPMKKYIVYGSKDISSPSYLSANSIYKINGIEFNVLQNNQWPSSEVLNMDINQYEAFRGALTKEFAMIQGPPGTGKTYIGLEIVKIIIENMYNTKKLKNPIMVVCMTNHALDQFLEGIWKITRNISRFGCGTKSDILVNYIPEMKGVFKNTQADLFRDALRDFKKSKQKQSLHIKNIEEIQCNKAILDLSCLKEVLKVKGYDMWFHNSYDLLSWLLYDISDVDGINPIDFIKEKKMFDSELEKKSNDPTRNKLFCITLKSIKLYITQIQYQLDCLDQNFDQEIDADVSLKQNLEVSLKIMNTIEKYINKHLKLYTSKSSIVWNNQMNPNLMEIRERWLLYYDWVHILLTNENYSQENVKATTRQYNRDVNKFRSINYMKSVENNHVIGMTTTAAAKNRYLLKHLKCPIVIIEEAAEVLEPHIIASMSEFCKHLILIGDHKQLRPQTANHTMGPKYNLDISLFERMIKIEIPSYVLTTQHRMRPEIAGLVTPAIYPCLKNHPSVLNRAHVRGVAMNVYCITHKKHEEKDLELSSFKNSKEANFLVALASYLLKQGYYPEDITIMAMYNAQVLYISDLVKSPPYDHLKNIRVSSVDGYQGEENEIVLLSLVRSNDINSVGFLKKNNRVCVALSRARLGFFIAGNLSLLAKNSKLWLKVKNYLCNLNALGPKLLLNCNIHNKVVGHISINSDLKNLLFGCKLKCDFKLSCGHICNKVCHNEDRTHLITSCSYACKKKCARGHKCSKMCFEECKCEVLISQVGNCNHTLQGKCCDIENIKCQFKVKEILTCGHTLERMCYEPSVCNELCNNKIMNCPFGHPCQKLCQVICGPCVLLIPTILTCGHIVEFPCTQVVQSTENLKCKVLVTNVLPCGHQISTLCSKSNEFNEQMDTDMPTANTNLPCKQLVPIDYKFICNHTQPLNVPCNLVGNGLPEKKLKKYCNKILSLKLKCGHYTHAMCDACIKSKSINCHKCIKKNKKLSRKNNRET